MQQEQPQLYATLTSQLSADEQTIITGACQQADNLLLQQHQTGATDGH